MNQFMNPLLFHTRQSHPVAEAAAMKKAIAHICTHHLMGVGVASNLRRRCVLRLNSSNLAETTLKKKKTPLK
jgi:hypothetical protein